MTDVTKFCARVGMVAMVSLASAGCSSVPDWVDPTTWVGGGDDSQTAIPSQNQDADAQSGETPDLAAIPDKPAAPSTPEEQQQVAQSLATDRSGAQYSADALRGGTEPVAAPPPPASAPDPEAAAPKVASAAPPPPPSDDTQKKKPYTGVFGTSFDAETAKPAAAPDTDSDIDTNTGAVTPSTAGASDATASAAPPPPPAPAASALPPAQPAPQQQMAMNNPSPAPSSSPAPQIGGMPTPAQVNPSDAQLGFQPSSAPPLDRSVGQFVPQPIITRYDQTASSAAAHQPHVAASAMMASNEPARRHKYSGKAMGGPEMSGAVVANLDALNTAPASAPAQAQASVYANPQGLPPSSVVFFPGDGTLLNADAKLRIRAAVEAFKRQGGNGFIRVVGHASSRTANMPVEKHLEVIFNKSQDRANAVAHEMIKDGVPAKQVLVEAVGDSQPVYYESMPKGEDGNRRAEIFVQS